MGFIFSKIRFHALTEYQRKKFSSFDCELDTMASTAFSSKEARKLIKKELNQIDSGNYIFKL